LLALKNVEGDIISEVVANAYATHGLMYNEVKGRNGEIMFETNHGTLA
jgi:isocitrate dehydrogenase